VKTIDSLNIPILFLVFNRPDTTIKIFNAIRNVKPQKLFIACDGPRYKNKSDVENVQKVRNYINDGIDWQCEVHTLFRDKNLGCKIAVSSAINWFFEKNEMGIVLEDDCVPHPSFFNYCEEMLIKYKDEKQVMQISGFNALKYVSLKESYYFAKFGPIWGWATWRRAWQKYDLRMKDWEIIKKEKLYKQYCDSKMEEIWRVNTYDKTFKGEINTWDYQWSFAKLINNGLSIIPVNNLIKNIGFGENATHTKKITYLNYRTDLGINFPLIHPNSIIRNKELDKKYFNNFVLRGIIMGKINKIFRS